MLDSRASEASPWGGDAGGATASLGLGTVQTAGLISFVWLGYKERPAVPPIVFGRRGGNSTASSATFPTAGGITPTHSYFYDDSNYGLVWGVPISLAGNPGYTVSGLAVLGAGTNGDYGVSCQLTATGATAGMSVVVPAADPAVTSQGGGLFVTAGTYAFEAPPALVNTVAPELTGYSSPPAVGDSVNCGTGTWSGYGYPHATYAYQWQRSATGVGSWANIGGETTADYSPADEVDAIQYLSCLVTPTVGGTSSSAVRSDVIGPIVGVVTFTDPASGSVVLPESGIYRFGAMGRGGAGGSGHTSLTTGAGGQGAGAGGLVNASRQCAAGKADYDTNDSGNRAMWTVGGNLVFGTHGSSGGTGGAGSTSGGSAVWHSKTNASGGGGLTAGVGAGGAGGNAPSGGLFVSGGTGGAGGTTSTPGADGGLPGGGGGGGGAGSPTNAVGGDGGESQLKIKFVAPIVVPTHVYAFQSSSHCYALFAGEVVVSGAATGITANSVAATGSATQFGSKTAGIAFVGTAFATSNNFIQPFKHAAIRNGQGAYASAGTYVLEAPPEPTITTAVTGQPSAVNVLTATTPTYTGWGESLATYLNKWQRSDDGSTSWTDIAAQTASTYTVVNTYTAKYIRCQRAPVLGATTGSYISSPAVGPIYPGSTGNGGLSSGNAVVPNNVNNDLLVLVLRRSGNVAAYSAPTDWTLQADDTDATPADNVAVYTRVSPGGVTTVNFASGTSSDVYTCTNLGPLTFDSASVNGSSTPSADIVAPDVTPSVSSTLLNVWTIQKGAGLTSITKPGGFWTVSGANLNPSSTTNYIVAAFEEVAAGATGTRTATASASRDGPVGVSVLAH